jgi:DNA ligase-1
MAYRILTLIKETKGTLAKEEILRKEKDNKDLKTLLSLSFNPFLNYGIKNLKLTKVSQENPKNFHEKFVNVAKFLSEISINAEQLQNTINFLEQFDKDTQEIYAAVITKSLSIGLAAKSINKIIPGLIPTFECMLAEPSTGTIEFPVVVQEKLDGVRCIMTKKDGKVTFYTRQGNTIPLLILSKILLELPNDNFILDGELLLKGTDRKNTSGKINSLLKSGYNQEIDELVEYYLFDFMSLEEWESKSSMFTAFERTGEVLGLVGLLRAPFFAPKEIVAYAEEDIHRFYKEIRANLGEGVIIKTDSTYEWKRSKNWTKMKAICMATLRIIDFVDGKGKNKGKVGAITCKSADGLLTVNINPKTDEIRQYITENRDSLRYSLVEVLFNELISDKSGEYSLFLPRMADNWLRFDKSKPDTLEDIKKEVLSTINLIQN